MFVLDNIRDESVPHTHTHTHTHTLDWIVRPWKRDVCMTLKLKLIEKHIKTKPQQCDLISPKLQLGKYIHIHTYIHTSCPLTTILLPSYWLTPLIYFQLQHKEIPLSNTTETLSTMAKVCQRMLENPWVNSFLFNYIVLSSYPCPCPFILPITFSINLFSFTYFLVNMLYVKFVLFCLHLFTYFYLPTFWLISC